MLEVIGEAAEDIMKTLSETGELVADQAQVENYIKVNETACEKMNGKPMNEMERFAHEAANREAYKIALERRPEVLAQDISKRILEEKLLLSWKGAAQEREKMMIRTSEIMMEEMKIPKEIQKKIKINFPHLGGADGNCGFFTRADGEGNIIFGEDPEEYVINIDRSLMEESDPGLALESMFHECSHAMQQVAATEKGLTWYDQVEMEEIRNFIRNPERDDKMVSYFLIPLERSSHLTDGYFTKILLASMQDAVESEVYKGSI